jgi:hypothetical protein
MTPCSTSLMALGFRFHAAFLLPFTEDPASSAAAPPRQLQCLRDLPIRQQLAVLASPYIKEQDGVLGPEARIHGLHQGEHALRVALLAQGA